MVISKKKTCKPYHSHSSRTISIARFKALKAEAKRAKHAEASEKFKGEQ